MLQLYQSKGVTSMIIHNPKLPPKEGYVEVEVECVRLYKDVRTGKTFTLEQVENQPTQTDRIEAQVAYTAMMTDTLLEG
jgi:hypothetical protein